MRKHFLITTLSLAFLAATGLGALTAQAQERLRPVGSVTYEPLPAEPETGVIQLDPENRRLRAFRIAAAQGSAEVRSVTVVYGNGERERVRVRQPLAEGERTPLLRLERPRPVRAIEISYVPRGKVRLVLLADAGGPPPPPPMNWVDLGCKSVGFLGDKDKLVINSDQPFRSLRLRSTGYDIEMLEMLVIYGNGSRDNFVIRQVIPSGAVTRPIDLRGEQRRISQINFLYRSTAIGTAKTRLCVEGLAARDSRGGDGEEDFGDGQ